MNLSLDAFDRWQATTDKHLAQLAADVIASSHRALQRGVFFPGLENGSLNVETLQFVFGQYRLWRDQFHTWFGLCIAKSGSCESPDVAHAVQALAEHTVEEIAGDHAGLYLEFLNKLGVSDDTLAAARKGDATLAYEQSFLTRFGVGSENFYEAMLALGARELFASIRNTYVMKYFVDQYDFEPTTWWTLHEELELEHFEEIAGPLARQRIADPDQFQYALQIAQKDIDLQVDYWDALVAESNGAPR